MTEIKSHTIYARQLIHIYFGGILINLLCLLILSKAIANSFLQQAFGIPQPTNINDFIYLGKSEII